MRTESLSPRSTPLCFSPLPTQTRGQEETRWWTLNHCTPIGVLPSFPGATAPLSSPLQSPYLEGLCGPFCLPKVPSPTPRCPSSELPPMQVPGGGVSPVSRD